jgi:hypothetical protein
MTRGARRAAWLLAAWLLAASAFAGGSGGDGGTTPDDPTPSDPTPTASQYRSGLAQGSKTDAYYETYACSQVSLGTYTTAHGMSTTSSSPYKSKYLAHNVRLYIDGTLVARSPDTAVSVSGASETNYITSIVPARVSQRLSCPQAFVVVIGSRGWHKGISIHGHSTSFYTSDSYSG